MPSPWAKTGHLFDCIIHLLYSFSTNIEVRAHLSLQFTALRCSYRFIPCCWRHVWAYRVAPWHLTTLTWSRFARIHLDGCTTFCKRVEACYDLYVFWVHWIHQSIRNYYMFIFSFFAWIHWEDSAYRIHSSYERQFLFGEVKSSLGANPGLSKTSYLACKTR